MSLPAARQRQIGFGDLLRHHPQRKDIAAIWPEAQPAVFLRDDRRNQPGAEEVGKVLGRKGRRLIVVSGARRKLRARQFSDAVNQRLPRTGEIKLGLDGATSY